MATTVGELRIDMEAWLREPIDPRVALGAIGDAIESLWESVMQANLSLSLGGPVSFSVGAGAERTLLTTIADPVSAPTINAVAGPGGPGDGSAMSLTYTVVTDSGSETKESPEATATVGSGGYLDVDAASIPWSNFEANGAIGVNIYLGPTPGSSNRGKQNDAPIPYVSSGTLWRWSDPLKIRNVDGSAPPTDNTTADNLFYIKQIEVADTNGTYHPWRQTDIAGNLWNIYQQSTASTDPTQPYAYDFVNQRTIEMRPAAGAALIPRYFYVVKPRRPRYDGAALPFPTLPQEAFLRSYALSKVAISLAEPEVAKGYRDDAEQERRRCIDSISRAAMMKQVRVRGYM